jgi:hypothetical protein
VGPMSRIAVAVALIGALAAPSGAAEPGAGGGAAPVVPGAPGRGEQVVTDAAVASGAAWRAGTDLHSAEQALRLTAQDTRSATAMIRSAAAAVGGIAVPGPATAGDAGSDDAEEAEDLGTYGALGAAGDLDGDGVPDALVWELDLTTWDDALRAVRGDDGTPLWDLVPAAHGTILHPALRDLDGDGADDLVRLDLTAYEVLVERCDEDGWSCEEYEAAFTWTAGPVSGRDLTPLWQVVRDGRVRESSTTTDETTSTTSEQVYEVEAGWVVPVLLESPSGPALLLDSISTSDLAHRRRAILPLVDESRSSRSSRSTHALEVRAADGTVLAAREVGPVTGRAYPSVLPGAAGEGDDVLLEELLRGDEDRRCTAVVLVDVACDGSETTYAHAATLLDGTTLQPIWSARVDDAAYGYVHPLGGDVDGDGVGDVVHRWVTPAVDGGDAGMTAIRSGGDGTELWRTDRYLAPVAAGDLDGDGLADVVSGWFEGEGDGEEAADVLVLRRQAGGDGRDLLTTRHRFAWTADRIEWGYGLVSPGDHDGDGAPDLVIGHIAYDVEEDADGMVRTAPAGSAAEIRSTRTDSVAWAVQGPGEGWLWPLADVDGDALPEYDWTRWVDAGIEVPLLDGATGSTRWALEIAAEWALLSDLGGGRLGLTVDVRDDAGRWSSLLSSLDGTDGRTVWTTRTR